MEAIGGEDRMKSREYYNGMAQKLWGKIGFTIKRKQEKLKKIIKED